jgi:hypothetical protein
MIMWVWVISSCLMCVVAVDQSGASQYDGPELQTEKKGAENTWETRVRLFRKEMENGEGKLTPVQKGNLGRLLVRNRENILEPAVSIAQLVASPLLALDALLAYFLSALRNAGLMSRMRKIVLIAREIIVASGIRRRSAAPSRSCLPALAGHTHTSSSGRCRRHGRYG